MVTSLKITSFVVLFIGAYLGAPKLIIAAQALTNENPQNFSSIAAPSSTQLDLNDESELPNFGAPDTRHGSGTR
jgi:hypothetical protein